MKSLVQKLFLMELNEDEYIDNKILKHSTFEPLLTNLIKQHVRSGDVFIDIGSNIGYFSLLASSIVGPTGRVYAFEPTSYAFNKMLLNISLNSFTNIFPSKLAISDTARSGVDITFKPENYLKGLDSSLRSSWAFNPATMKNDASFQLDNLQNIDTCDFVIFDQFTENNNLNRIDFIKIDVDGNENKVLNGSISTILKHKPTIAIELDYNRGAIDPHNLLDDAILNHCRILINNGYKIFHETGIEFSRLDSFLEYFEQRKALKLSAGNFIFKHKPKN
jgi:FkbM family methyltransferase